MEVFLLLGNEPMCISVTAEPFPQLRKGEFRFRIGLILEPLMLLLEQNTLKCFQVGVPHKMCRFVLSKYDNGAFVFPNILWN